MDFNFAKYIFILKPLSFSRDPFLLFRCRSDYQQAFKDAVNCRRADCARCGCQGDCPYPRLFGQSLSLDPQAVKRYQKPPLPFIFDLPTLTPDSVGDHIEIGLTLIGSAVLDAGNFAAALEILLRNYQETGTFSATISRIETVGFAGEREVVAERGSPPAWDRSILLSASGIMDSRTVVGRELSIRIITPLKLLHDGRMIKNFHFSPFVRALNRRISSLAYYYCDSELALDFRWLAEKSESIRVIDSKFRWTAYGKGDSLSGVAGSGLLAGDFEEFYPFLLLGEHLHLGKGAAFGLGRFEVGRPDF